MLLNSWLVRFLITRAARAYGFLDPIKIVARIRGFSEPSEFAEPLELLRAGMIFHARGLINTKAIQNNLDWVWPYWVERQFNPADDSFIPRGFSFSHINLTHRNWTAVGMPDFGSYSIVDPCGLVTPLFDGWSLDFWIVSEQGELLLPSRRPGSSLFQSLEIDGDLRVRSRARWDDGASLESEVRMDLENHQPRCRVQARAEGTHSGFLAVGLRPYNPEGISFINHVAIKSGGEGWLINQRDSVGFNRRPSHAVLSVYKEGDGARRLDEPSDGRTEVSDPTGMATAVAMFSLKDLAGQPVEITAPLPDELTSGKPATIEVRSTWPQALAPLASLSLADQRIQQLYERALATLVLYSPDEVYPGPYTYKRFWFRDAAFILNGLLTLGGIERTRRALEHFASRQRHDGYFLSQQGEWDSNGEAIWTYHRYVSLTGEAPRAEWLKAVAKGVRWIMRKRLPAGSGRPEAGLLPAGFSAEHLGPNDFYYWDDFWGVAGLRCGAELLATHDLPLAQECRKVATEFLAVIERSFPRGTQRRFPGAIPASPTRRMDSGAVGSLVADYPLQLFPPGDERILKTADYLRDHSSYDGGFFQHMIHSGINPYLTLHLAQVRLRAGDAPSAWSLMNKVAELASPTGQWPEAVHPKTGGGCMGDGQHVWAACEWVMMVRNCFVREERSGLILGSGLRHDWWREAGASLGPTLTPFGRVTVRVDPKEGNGILRLEGAWRGIPPRLEVRLPGFKPEHRSGAGAEEVFKLVPSP